jgi:hypothetical protein
MKPLALIALFSFLVFVAARPGLAQGKSDICHVYVVDVAAAEAFFKKHDPDTIAKMSKQEQVAIGVSSGVTEFEQFPTKVGEEELTNNNYPFPGSKKLITASVFYTDESMASTNNADSMLLAVVVADKAYKDAIGAPDNAVAEVSYSASTDVARVKRNVLVNGRQYLLGLECRCKGDRAAVK